MTIRASCPRSCRAPCLMLRMFGHAAPEGPGKRHDDPDLHPRNPIRPSGSEPSLRSCAREACAAFGRYRRDRPGRRRGRGGAGGSRRSEPLGAAAREPGHEPAAPARGARRDGRRRSAGPSRTAGSRSRATSTCARRSRTSRRREPVTATTPRPSSSITTGGMTGIFNALLAITDPGDEVVVTDPTYAGIVNRIRLASGTPVFAPFRRATAARGASTRTRSPRRSARRRRRWCS